MSGKGGCAAETLWLHGDAESVWILRLRYASLRMTRLRLVMNLVERWRRKICARRAALAFHPSEQSAVRRGPRLRGYPTLTAMKLS
jgi:hypothetical protein